MKVYGFDGFDSLQNVWSADFCMSMPKAPQKSVFSTLLKNNCDGGGDARGRRYQIEYGHRYRYRYRYKCGSDDDARGRR